MENSGENLAAVDSEVLMRLLSDPTSSVMQSVYSKYALMRQQQVQKGGDKRVTIRVPWYMLPTDLAKLHEIFPVFKFYSTATPIAPVPLMEACRYVIVEVFVQTDNWPGEKVVHLNGGIVASALRSRADVHSCLDISDFSIHTAFLHDMMTLERMHSGNTSKKLGMVDEYCAHGSEGKELFCQDPKSCLVYADTIWIDHCGTDMPMIQVAAVMDHHSASRVFGTIFYDSNMLEDTQGTLGGMDAEWFVDNDKDEIVVVSLVDRSVVWRHNYSAWKQIVTGAGLYYKGNQFVWEIIAHYGVFYIYRMVKLLERPTGDTVLRYKRWDNIVEGQVRLTSWIPKVGSDLTLEDSWEKLSCIWPTELYHKVAKKAISLEIGKYDIESLRRHLRDHNSTIITSGSVVTTPRYKVMGRDADIGIVAIYNLVFKSRYESGKCSVEMRDACNALSKLKTAGLVELYWALVSEKFRTGLDIVAEKFTFWKEDFSVAPEAEYLTGYKDYEVIIPPGGMKAESVRLWESKCNTGFPVPKSSSGLSILEAFRRDKEKFKVPKANKVPSPSSSGRSSERLISKPLPASALLSVDAENVPQAVVVAERSLASAKLRDAYDLTSGGVIRTSVYTIDDLVSPVPDNDDIFVHGPVYDLQSVVDQMFPGMSLVPLSVRTGLVHITDLDIFTNAHYNSINTSKMTLPPPVSVVESRLRAPVEMDRPQTTTETLIAFYSRNNDTPYLRDPTSPVAAAQGMWDYLASSGFFVDDYKEKLEAWTSDTGMIKLTLEESDSWLARATGSTIAELLACDIAGISDNTLNVYNLMVKAQVKPKLENSVVTEYTKLQTVTYHQKRTNALFSPLFVSLAQRFCQLFNPKIIIQMRKSSVEMQSTLRSLVAMSGGYSGINNFEADQSKFDKSQDHVSLELERLVYTMLGLDPSVLTTWVQACEYGEVASVSAGFRAFVAYQRKTGTGTTTLGNTLVNVFSTITAFKFKIEDVAYAIFLGDDSLVGYRGVKIGTADGIQFMSSVMNLQVKAFNSDVGYICSQYVVPDGDGNVVLMSDPVKRICVLGRAIKVNVAQRSIVKELEEKWLSYKDLMVNYNNSYCRESLADCVSKRVVTNGSILRGIETLASLRGSFLQFCEVYEDKITRHVC